MSINRREKIPEFEKNSEEFEIERSKEIEEKVVVERLLELNFRFRNPGMPEKEKGEVVQYIENILHSENLPQELRLKIMEEVIEHPDFNNLILRLPGGFFREDPRVSDEQLDMKQNERCTCTLREVMRKIDEDFQEKGFDIQEVEKIMKEWNEEIQKLNKFYSPEQKQIVDQVRDKLTDICRKIYPSLRAKGLNYFDLCV